MYAVFQAKPIEVKYPYKSNSPKSARKKKSSKIRHHRQR